MNTLCTPFSKAAPVPRPVPSLYVGPAAIYNRVAATPLRDPPSGRLSSGLVVASGSSLLCLTAHPLLVIISIKGG